MSNLCASCGSKHTERVAEPLHPCDLLGAPFPVYLDGAVVTERCRSCGGTASVEIKKLKGLIAAVAMARAADPRKLSGPEIKFLRKSAGWRAKFRAEEVLGVDPATVSRWEAGSQAINEMHEKLLRVSVCIFLMDDNPLSDFNTKSLIKMVTAMRIRPVTSIEDQYSLTLCSGGDGKLARKAA